MGIDDNALTILINKLKGTNEPTEETPDEADEQHMEDVSSTAAESFTTEDEDGMDDDLIAKHLNKIAENAKSLTATRAKRNVAKNDDYVEDELENDEESHGASEDDVDTGVE